MSEQDRLERLEREVAILRAEFARLREHVRGGGEAHKAEHKPPPPPPPPPQPKAEAPAGANIPDPVFVMPERRRSLEDVIGRYVMIAFATVLVLLAVGTFLRWAIRNELLGPTARVVLGYAGAAGLAYGGIRLRMRGTREFGNVLLAIALGVVHLVCWAAGPLLHVVPSPAALGIGLLASVVLAEFALRHDEEMLCAVGFGGAALAPFITGSRDGSRIALAVYGVVVVALGAAALGARRWKYARGVVMWSVILFGLMSGAGDPLDSPPAWISYRLWVLTPALIAAAVIPFTHAEHRRSMLRVSAGALILGAFFRADQWGPDLASVAIALVGTVIIVGALDVTRGGAIENEDRLLDREALLDGFLIPVGLFAATVSATPEMVSLQSALVGVLFAGAAVWLTHRARGEHEGAYYARTAALIALWIVPAAFASQDLARAAGAGAMGILLLQTAHRMSRAAFVAGAIGSFVSASLFAIEPLADRASYTYAPFLTILSASALVAVAGWVAGARIVSPPAFMPGLDLKMRASVRETLITGATLTAFIWGALELGGAWNRTAATALSIVYYAASASLAIHFGRERNVRHLRLAGLALALWAAVKAIIEAVNLPNVAVRVSVFAAVAAFLLGIGYWYRRGVGDK